MSADAPAASDGAGDPVGDSNPDAASVADSLAEHDMDVDAAPSEDGGRSPADASAAPDGSPDGSADGSADGLVDGSVDKLPRVSVPVFVAVGYDPASASAPRVATSCDGRVWKSQTIALPPGDWSNPELNGLRGLGFGGGRLVAVGGGSGSGMDVRRLYVSMDGVQWVHENQAYECAAGASCNASNICTTCQFMGDAAWLDDGSANGLWVTGGGVANRLYSLDGAVTWKRLPAGTVGSYRRMASGGARAAASADSGLSLIQVAPGQTPPLAWTDQAMANITEPSLAFGSNQTVVAVWWNTGCRYFASGAWASCALPRVPTTITSVVNDGTSFWVLGRDPPYVSPNGMTYTQSATTAGTDFRQVRFGGGVFVAPDIRQWSTNGIQWQAMPTPPTFLVTDVEVGYLSICP